MSIELKLKELIISGAKMKELSPNEISLQTDLLTDLNFDSISIIKLVVDIESFFGIEFDDNMLDFQTLTKFDVLLDYVQSKYNIMLP